MRIFMTGATGFIGKHLCRRLVAGGHTVFALVRNPGKTRGLPTEGMHYIEGDLAVFKDARLELPTCDVVIHLAGVVTAPNLETYEEINFVAVKDLVRCIERQRWKPRRFLFASSLAAGGPSLPGERKTETDPAAPIDAYGKAKWEAEKFL